MYTMTDREIDVLVAERVMGFQRPQLIMTASGDMDWSYNADTPPRAVGRGGFMKYVNRYSTTGDGMLAVVEKMREMGWDRQRFDRWFHGEWRAQFSFEQRPGKTYATRRAYGTAADLPRAVCLAALKAMGEGV